MANLIEEIRLINVSLGINKNRFWTGQLYDNGDVITLWGRVGYKGQSKIFPNAGETFLEKKKREKYKDGYTKVRTVDANTSTVVPIQDNLNEIAKSQIIKTDKNPILSALIDRLVSSNVHRITSNTQITYSAQTGLFSTPLGIVTLDGIIEARLLLARIAPLIRNSLYNDQLNDLAGQYLRIIPQNVGMKLNIRTLLPDEDSIQKQLDLIDSLEASYQALQNNSTPQSDGKASIQEQVFSVSLDVLDNNKERDRLINWFEKSKKSIHHYDNVRVREVYVVDIHDMTKNYDHSKGNDKEVFHGTSQGNCLSILKSGLKTSPPSTAAIAGKMWGNGVYGSLNSTKSLGYTFGRWGQGGVGDSGWLFICDFAMGKIHYPTYTRSYPPNGYDSIWAQAQKTGLANDELIVYKNSHVRIKYLLECK